MKFLVSGLLNVETTCPVRGFPINYYPIDYVFFGIDTKASGVALNVSKALKTLGDEVKLCSLIGNDFSADYVLSDLKNSGIDVSHVKKTLKETPSSTVLYDNTGARQIYCDLKNAQETDYGFTEDILDDVDFVIACNVNFSRPLLSLAKKRGIPVATDVHVLSNIYDDFNRDFLNCADVLFLSDEAIGDRYQDFIRDLKNAYPAKIIVVGRGGKGASVYQRSTDEIIDLPAFYVDNAVNTVGAGDALFSSFLHFYLKSGNALDSLTLAQGFSALKIRFNGGSLGFSDEVKVKDFVNSHKK